MEVELKNYKRYCRHVKWLLVVCGVWPNHQPILDRLVSTLAALSTLTISVASLNFCFHHSADVVVVTKCLGRLISCFSSFLKICVFLSHREDLVYLNDNLAKRHSSDLSSPDDRADLLRRFPSFSKFFYVLSVTVALTFIFVILLTILATRRGVYLHIYMVIYPFEIEPGGSLYWSLICLELVASFFVATVTSGVDSVFGLYALQMCGELRILARRFEDLGSGRDYGAKMRDCMERHHLLMRSKSKLEEVFGFLAIWLAVTSAIVQCSLMFQVKMELENVKPTKIAFLFFYIVMKLVQAFVYAWYGSLIAEESALCLSAMYNARWPGSGDTRFMRDVVVVLSQRPLVFKAKSCMQLHMDVFIKIMNTSASYFFLLLTLDENSERRRV